MFLSLILWCFARNYLLHLDLNSTFPTKASTTYQQKEKVIYMSF
jgi:hypothetical protein